MIRWAMYATFPPEYPIQDMGIRGRFSLFYIVDCWRFFLQRPAQKSQVPAPAWAAVLARTFLPNAESILNMISDFLFITRTKSLLKLTKTRKRRKPMKNRKKRKKPSAAWSKTREESNMADQSLIAPLAQQNSVARRDSLSHREEMRYDIQLCNFVHTKL